MRILELYHMIWTKGVPNIRLALIWFVFVDLLRVKLRVFLSNNLYIALFPSVHKPSLCLPQYTNQACALLIVSCLYLSVSYPSMSCLVCPSVCPLVGWLRRFRYSRNPPWDIYHSGKMMTGWIDQDDRMITLDWV